MTAALDYGKRSLSVGVVGEAVRLLEESGGFSRGWARDAQDYGKRALSACPFQAIATHPKL